MYVSVSLIAMDFVRFEPTNSPQSSFIQLQLLWRCITATEWVATRQLKSKDEAGQPMSADTQDWGSKVD